MAEAVASVLIVDPEFKSSHDARAESAVEEEETADPLKLTGSARPLVKGPRGDFAFSGLFFGVFRAWKDEHGVALSPAILFHAVVVSVVKAIKDHPDPFRHLFTNKRKGKESIIVVSEEDPATIDPASFLDLLASRIANKELLAVITEVQGLAASAPGPTDARPNAPPFAEVMCTTMLEMASPYFEYSCTRCGIRAIELLGSVDEWNTLLEKVQALDRIVGGVKMNSWSSNLTSCLFNNCIKRIEYLRDVVAGRPLSAEERHDLVSKCFQLKGCMSGHPYDANGWIFDFSTSSILGQIGPQSTYVAWDSIDTRRMFYRAYALHHGDLTENREAACKILHMSFEMAVYEVLDVGEFKRLAMRKDEEEMD